MPKTVLITGGMTGIGREISKAFNNDNWKVYATSRNPQNYEVIENVQTIKMDLSSFGSIKGKFDKLIKKSGQIDVLINNAGYGLIGPTFASTADEIQEQFSVNFYAALELIRLAVPIMISQGHGHIINISSIAAIRAVPGLGIYAASKMALEGASEALAAELAQFNIKVSLVQPGAVNNSWVDNCITISDKNHDIFNKKIIENMKIISSDGQRPSDIGAQILELTKSKSPDFRTQTSSQAQDIAKRFYMDHTGNEVLNNMIQRINNLKD